MSTMSVRIPESLHETVRQLAKRDQVSMNQFITTALAEKISAMMTEDYLERRAQKGSRAKFEAAMSKVPDTEPEGEDRF